MKRFLVKILIRLMRLFYSIWYSPKYLKGRCFSDEYLSKGWRQIHKIWKMQIIKGWNRNVPWPCYPGIMIANPDNIIFDVDDIDNFFQVGNYYQGINAKIIVGSGTAIGPGVGIITANHDFNDILKSQEGKDVIIGEKCWIGMNAIILPGVVLGDHTIVGAGAIVTHSFKEGNCVIAGNPARIIKTINE